MAVMSVMEVTPVPEHAVIVEQSVVKPLVTVPDTMFVPLHCGMAVAEHELLLDEADDSLLDLDGSSGSVGFPEGGG